MDHSLLNDTDESKDSWDIYEYSPLNESTFEDPLWDKQAESVSVPIPSSIGLRNIGNSCYLNATIQVFLQSPTLFSLFKKEFFPDEDLTLLNLYDNIGAIRFLYTEEMDINFWDQCDSRLLFCWILDRIKESYRKEEYSLGLEYFSNHLEQQIQLFRICNSCQKRESTLQIEFCTPLYPFENINTNEPIPIYKLVNAQYQKQAIERKCPHCGYGQSTQRRRTLKDPENLFYSLESQHFRVCLDECVETPLKNTFNLKGFIVHIGTTKDFGHYVIYICNEFDEWTLYDDDLIVKRIDISSFLTGTYSSEYTIKMIWYVIETEDDSIDLT
jgi:uncharacterized UBP type Zn finger protein